MKFLSGIILFFLLVAFRTSYSQSHSIHNSVWKHYAESELDSVLRHDKAEYDAIVYYFNNSYQVDFSACQDCVPADPSDFDVFRFENMRLAEHEFSRYFEKTGMTLRLIPYAQMTFPLPDKIKELKSVYFTTNVLVKSIE